MPATVPGLRTPASTPNLRLPLRLECRARLPANPPELGPARVTVTVRVAAVCVTKGDDDDAHRAPHSQATVAVTVTQCQLELGVIPVESTERIRSSVVNGGRRPE